MPGTVTRYRHRYHYTLFKSAKLSGVDPRAYVLEAARRAIRTPGTVTLPSDFA